MTNSIEFIHDKHTSIGDDMFSLYYMHSNVFNRFKTHKCVSAAANRMTLYRYYLLTKLIELIHIPQYRAWISQW